MSLYNPTLSELGNVMSFMRKLYNSLSLLRSISCWVVSIVVLSVVLQATMSLSVAAQSQLMTTNVSYAPKGRPPLTPGQGQNRVMMSAPSSNGYCQGGVCYYENNMVAYGFTATGATVKLTQAKPTVSSRDYHSLVELAVESADDQQIVEFGWIVAPDVNGDSLPHLFVYHWVNGQSTCYNGCGFVPTSLTYKAGGLIKENSVGTYTINYVGNKWVIYYNGTELGYFPESLWKGSFTSTQAVQAFGEIASPSTTKPLSQMGNGVVGTSAKSATMSGFSVIGSNEAPTLIYDDVQAPAVYKMGRYNTACTNECGMGFGGPGY